jgi:hypothetical protein
MEILNKAIELHNSEVGAITNLHGRIVVHFSPAYLHQSEGRPGVDSGTGWTQAVDMIFESAQISGRAPDFPCVIWNGDFSVEGRGQQGLISIPLCECSESELNLQFDEIQSLCIRGKQLKLILLESPKFIERFPGGSNSSAQQE